MIKKYETKIDKFSQSEYKDKIKKNNGKNVNDIRLQKEPMSVKDSINYYKESI